MSLFGQPPTQEDASKSDKSYQAMMAIVGDKSPFGKFYSKTMEILKTRNVPATRFPSREHFMSRLLSSIDETKLNDWLTKYIELEAMAIDNDIEKSEGGGGGDNT